MSSNPFATSPDVLALELGTIPAGMTVRNFVSEWGVTDERLCFYNDILIGRFWKAVSSASIDCITLLPKLDRQRRYPWPDMASFCDALFLLIESTTDWTIWCEADAEQNEVEAIIGLQQAQLALRAALAYSAGAEVDCPNFRAGLQI